MPEALAGPGDIVGDPFAGTVQGVMQEDRTIAPLPSQEGAGGDPGGAGSGGPAEDEAAPVTDTEAAEMAVAQDVAAAESGSDTAPSVETPATDVPTDPATQAAVEVVQETLGGTVVGVEDHADNLSKEGHCPICGKSMGNEAPDLVQLSRLKHRTLVLPDGRKFYDTGGCCYDDYQSLNEQKANKTGLYAPA